jgi:NADH:ubiquinone oxidoreductase subunit 5 (subunit L)/multisubunit Na+/H+ antiporter MnhA subunit
MMPPIVNWLWIIPLVPLLAAAVILQLPRTQRRVAAGIAICGQAVAFVVAAAAFAQTLGTPGFRAVHNFTWFTFGEHAVRIGFLLDPLTAAMLVMITFVALWIFVFSTGYMADDRNFNRSSLLSFFTAAMLGVGSRQQPAPALCLLGAGRARFHIC